MTSDIAGPSPRNMSTAQATSLTSITNSKPKRPVVPTTTGSSSMPRPLHLALGSVVSSSSSPSTPSSLSPCPSPGPSRTDQHLSVNGNSPSDGVGDGVGLAGSSSANTPNTSRAPSPSPLSPAITGLKRHSASSKRSSISYIPSNGPSPSQSQFAQQRSSMDGPGFVRSPLSSTHPPTSFFGVGDEAGRMSGAGAGLSRSNSLGSRGPRTPKSLTFNEKSTSGASSISGTGATQLGSKDMNGSNQMPARLKERPPVTLAEKHAELLHFIAQKESKCLELRSELAVHEAELLQLKRKWERIVNRGFERSMSAGTANPSAPVPLSASSLSTSPTSPSSFPNNAGPSPSSYFPSLAPAGAVPGAVVLEGIKGGVQGMSRLIAAGIESIVLVNGPSTPSSATPSSHPNDVSSASSKSIPPRTDTVPVSKHWDTVNARVHGHGQKESQSSSSTTTSAASSSTFSSLSSASSATSASSSNSTKTSISGSSSTSVNTTKKLAASSSSTSTSGTDKDTDTDADADSDFGEFEEGRARLSLEKDQEQVLMVDDTGATPTMSPNPHFRRRNEAVEHLHVEKLVLSPLDSHTDTRDSELSVNSAKKSSSTQEEEQEEFDWDDGWGEPVVKSKSKVQDRDRDMGAGASDTASLNDVSGAGAGSGVQTKSGGPTSLPLSPTIPGLGALNMNMGAPTTQQMSSWVGSMGKRWDELKGSTTFTKSQKRASLLLSDMQNTIVSALISPPPSSSNSNAPTFSPPNQQISTSKPTLSSFSSNASHSSSRSRSPNLTVTASPSPLSTKPTTSRSTTSLLDDSDDEHENENLNTPSDLRSSSSSTTISTKSPRIVVPVMVPDSLSPLPQAQSQLGLKKGKAATTTGASPVANLKVVDDDEWNW